MSNKSELRANNADIQALIDKARTLPDAIVLPELNNPATEDKVISGYEYIDAEGNLKTGSAPQVITSTTEVEEGSASSYPEDTLYIVYEEG